MAESNLTTDDVRKLAADIGLSRLSEDELQQLLRATNASRARRAKLRLQDLTPADEPAHVFKFGSGDLK